MDRKIERILLKTTIGPVEDDWNIVRFSMLSADLAARRGRDGEPLYAVTTRDRTQNAAGDDQDLERLAAGDYDQLWLFAVDVTGNLTGRDCDNIARFRAAGGGVLLSRDHQNLGACLIKLGAIGSTQHFQTENPEPEDSRHGPDDTDTPTISWPNYHTGANGDYQDIIVVKPDHPVMRRADGGALRHLPSHPHEGAVGVPPVLATVAHVLAQGTSRKTGAHFNLTVAIEQPGLGRAVSDASFHHFCDYNWDPGMGAPSFVSEKPGDAILRNPAAQSDARTYAGNIAAWLARFR